MVKVRRKLALYDRHSLAKSPRSPFAKGDRRGFLLVDHFIEAVFMLLE
jgi:hypothetical protein